MNKRQKKKLIKKLGRRHYIDARKAHLVRILKARCPDATMFLFTYSKSGKHIVDIQALSQGW